MRLLLILSAVLLAAFARAQNVGIGKSTPTEKLDVAGNVNIDGRLKLNGSAGQPGQTLMVQPDGSQQWINSFGYKRRVSIIPGFPFVVPPDVNEILIEALGGGGGGAKGGGGGGGGYVVVKVKVAPGSIVSTGISANTQSGNPSFTELGSGVQGAWVSSYGTGFTLTADGGTAASSTMPGGGRGGFASGDSVIYVNILPGGDGTPMVESYAQRSATEFVTMRKQGDGGFSAYDPTQFPKGGFFSFNSQTLSNITLISTRTIAECYGCGGAGGNAFSGYWGGSAGLGRVFISY